MASRRSLGVLTLDLVAKTGAFEQGMDRAARKAEADMRRMREGATAASAAIGRVFGLLGGAFIAQGLVRMADDWGQINARLKLATQSTSELELAQRRLLEIANRTYRSYGEAANQFANSARSLREFGIGTAAALDSAEALSLALVAGASGAQESTAALNAFSRAAAQGVIDTRQLQTLLTQTPRVAQALAEGLGVTTSELVRMARNGELLMSRVVPALNTQLAKLREEVESMPTTVGDAMQQLANKMLRLSGIVNDSTSATQRIVRLLEAVGNNLNAIAVAAGVAGAALTGPYIARFAGMIGSLIAVQRTWLATTIANTAALRATTVAAIAASAAAARLRVALSALVGGTWGAALLAVGGAFALQARSMGKAREEMSKFREEAEKLSGVDLGLKMAEVSAEIVKVREQIANLSQRAKNDGVGRFLEQRLKILTEQYGIFEEVAKRTAALLPTRSEILDDEVQQLTSLIRLQGASAGEWERAREIIRQSREELARTNGEDEESKKRRIALLERIEKLEGAMKRGGSGSTTDAVQQMQREAAAAAQRLDAAREYGATAEELEIVTQAILAQERKITEEIEKQGGVVKADLRLIEERLRLLRQLALPTITGPTRIEGRTETPEIQMPQLAELERMAQAVREAQAAFDLAVLSPNVDTTGVEAARRHLEETTEAARQTEAAVAAFLLSLNLPPDVLAAMLEKMREAMGGVETSTKNLGSTFTRTAATVARGALNMATAVGRIDESIRRSLASTIDLVDAWDAFKEAQKAGESNTMAMAGSMMGIVGAGLGLVSGFMQLFDRQSEAEVMRERVVESNTQAIRELTARVDGFRNTFGAMGEGIEMATRVPMNVVREIQKFFARFPEMQRGAAEALFQQYGISFEQLERLAKVNGIDLLDEKGRLVAESFEQLAVVLELARKNAMQFGGSFSDVQRQMDARNRIFQIDMTPAQEFADSIALLENFSEPIAAMFASIDVTTEEGRTLARDLLKRLYTSAEAGMDGEFADLILGSGFENINEFLDSILGISDALDAFREETDKATASVQNVPAGWRIQNARFEATRARDIVGPPVVPGPPAVTRDYLAPTPADTRAQPISQPVLQPINYYYHGDVYIDAREKPVGQAFDEWEQEANRRLRSRHGSLTTVMLHDA